MMTPTEDNRRRKVLAEEARLTGGSCSVCWEPTITNYLSAAVSNCNAVCVCYVTTKENNKQVSDFQDACCLDNDLQNYHTV